MSTRFEYGRKLVSVTCSAAGQLAYQAPCQALPRSARADIVFSLPIIVSTSDSPLIAAVTMSQQTPTASSSSSNLQAIFAASLKEYEKKTEKTLLTHPLMAQFHACNSPTDILAVLRSQVGHFEETTAADENLIKWLDPIVNVLSASSSEISAGIGLVNSIQMVPLQSNI